MYDPADDFIAAKEWAENLEKFAEKRDAETCDMVETIMQ